MLFQGAGLLPFHPDVSSNMAIFTWLVRPCPAMFANAAARLEIEFPVRSGPYTLGIRNCSPA